MWWEVVLQHFKYLIGEGYPDLKRYVSNKDALPDAVNEHNLLIQDFYREMLVQFTKNDDEIIPFADLVEVFTCVLGECNNPRNGGSCIFSIGHVEEFIRILTAGELKSILDCLVEQRFSCNTFHMKNLSLTDFMYDEYDSPAMSETLIRYGFKYDFEDGYLYSLCDLLFDIPLTYPHDMDEEENFYLPVDIDGLCEELSGLRLQMVLELLVALFVDDKNKKVVSLLWRSLPYPFITANEIYDLLEPYHDNARLDRLRNVCDEFQKINSIFPVPEVLQPRSLKHLSRVQIRKCLNEASSLNNVTIQRLDIPADLKVYLQLDAL